MRCDRIPSTKTEMRQTMAMVVELANINIQQRNIETIEFYIVSIFLNMRSEGEDGT